MQTIDHYERAMRLYVDDLPRWRALNRAAAELREGTRVYQPYPHKNKALVKALHDSLAEHMITHSDFACMLANVRGGYR